MIVDRFNLKIVITLLPAIFLLLIVSVQPVGSAVPFVKQDVIPITALGSFSADGEYVVGTYKTKLLQFDAGSHVLVFRQGGIYVASSDHALKVGFVGAQSVSPVEKAKSPSTSDNLQSTLPPLGTVTYSNLWDGISLVYEKDSKGLVKCTYHIALGTRPSQLDQIRLAYNVPVRLDNRGQLLLKFKTGQFIETVPVAWQEIGGEHIPVDVSFRILGENEVGFNVGTYDPVFPLVIDPVMSWNTFMGSADHDFTGGITVDRSGNVYVAVSSDATWGIPVKAPTGSCDAFAAKLLTRNEVVKEFDILSMVPAILAASNNFLRQKSNLRFFAALRVPYCMRRIAANICDYCNRSQGFICINIFFSFIRTSKA